MIPDDGRAESPRGICVPKHVTGSLISARDWRTPKTIAFGRFLWAPRVRFHLKIVKRRHRPVFGDLEPSYEAFERPAERGHRAELRRGTGQTVRGRPENGRQLSVHHPASGAHSGVPLRYHAKQAPTHPTSHQPQANRRALTPVLVDPAPHASLRHLNWSNTMERRRMLTLTATSAASPTGTRCHGPSRLSHRTGSTSPGTGAAPPLLPLVHTRLDSSSANIYLAKAARKLGYRIKK